MLTYTAKMKIVTVTCLIVFAGIIVADAASLLRMPPASYAGTISKYTPSSQPTSVSTSSFITTSPTTSSNGTGSTNSTATTSDTTTNWAGYVSTGSTYTSVSGTWTIPDVTASDDSVAADATWIGIGGDSSNDLIQIGTQNMIENGQTTTGSFYEQLPDTSETIPGVSVNAGDTISASVKETTSGEWTVTINDLTNGESYSNTVAYNSSESSAEWIEEAPSTGESVIPLDQFGSVAFSNGSTTENGNSVSIAGSNAQMLTMDNEAGQALTDTSAITASGDGFTVTRTDASSSDDLYGAGGQYDIPEGWTRHEPGLGMWSHSWGQGEGQSYDFTNYY